MMTTTNMVVLMAMILMMTLTTVCSYQDEEGKWIKVPGRYDDENAILEVIAPVRAHSASHNNHGPGGDDDVDDEYGGTLEGFKWRWW
jgi:hypothetical protein